MSTVWSRASNEGLENCCREYTAPSRTIQEADTRAQVYYEQASRTSPDVSHLSLPPNLDFSIRLRLISSNSTRSPGEGTINVNVKAKAFECATIPALMISVHHYFTKYMAQCISHGKEPVFSSVRVEGINTTHPLTSDNDYHLIFEKHAVRGILTEAEVKIDWIRQGTSDLSESTPWPVHTHRRRNAYVSDFSDLISSMERNPLG
jgi:hypothetical protein